MQSLRITGKEVGPGCHLPPGIDSMSFMRPGSAAPVCSGVQADGRAAIATSLCSSHRALVKYGIEGEQVFVSVIE